MNRNGVLQSLVTWGARRAVRRHHPRVVAVTGSVGKTSAKEAVARVLGDGPKIRASRGNYNNQLGVPLTILGCTAPGRSPSKWLSIFKSAIRAGGEAYPETLILEMAADHPGDIRYLTHLAPPDIAVVTRVAPVHTVFFGSVEAVAAEKGVLVESLRSGGTAVLNRDDERVWQMRSRTQERVVSYGVHPEADVRGERPTIQGDLGSEDHGVGLQFDLSIAGTSQTVSIPDMLGVHHLTSILAAAVVGWVSGIPAQDIAQRLQTIRPLPGRLRLLPGIKRTWILDDTYSASPDATVAALRVTHDLRGVGRRYGILADMEELGSYTESGHEEVGRVAAETVDVLVTVGDKSRITAEAAKRAGLSADRIFTFDDRADAGIFVQGRLEPGDLVLVKGSQATRMEKVVHELMAEPLRAGELLVRQDPAWLRR